MEKKTTKKIKNKKEEKITKQPEKKVETEEKASGNFWSKIGKFVKDAVDCCLE